jgi:DNA-binding GntR family transcriptional regulator
MSIMIQYLEVAKQVTLHTLKIEALRPGKVAMALTNADIAYRIIKEKIITVEMPPGSLIQESQLMQELTLGRTPIREALKQLESEKLVIFVPRRGMFVSDVQITDLQQIYEVRMTIERLGARLAAERATTEDIEEMESCCRKMVNPDHVETRELILIDRNFHRLLAQATHNKFLMSEIEQFYNLSLRLWHLSLNKVVATDLDTDRHFAILQAIKNQDIVCAEELMGQHIQHFHRTVRAVL